MGTAVGTKRKMGQHMAMLAAQRWSRVNKIPAAVRKILRDAIENKTMKQVKGHLDTVGPTWYPTFKKLNSSGAHLLEAAVVFGLAYPDFVPKCIACGVELKAFKLKTCDSRECRTYLKQSALTEAAAKRTSEEREAIATKKVATMMRNHGVRSPMQIPGVAARAGRTTRSRTAEQKTASRAKRNETLRKGLGDNYEEIIQSRARSGVVKAYNERGDAILAKKMATMKSRYGAAHAMQVDHIRERAQRFRLKSVRLGRKTYKCQGYEPIVLKALHEAGYSITTSAHGIPYSDAQGAERRYYPDILAKTGSKRFIIEVKSEYTYKHALEHNPRKLFAGTARAKSCGADFVLIVVHPNSRFCYLAVNPRRVPTKDRLSKQVLAAWWYEQRGA